MTHPDCSILTSPHHGDPPTHLFIMKTLLLCVPFLLAACLSTSLYAEAATLISLSSVPNRVRKNNIELKAARLLLDEALADAQQSGKRSNPHIETELLKNRINSQHNASFSINQKFPLTRRLSLEKKQATTAIQAAQSEIQTIELQLIHEAKQYLIKAIANRQWLEKIQQEIQTISSLSNQLKTAASQGQENPVEATLTSLNIAEMKIQSQQCIAEEIALLHSLKLILGLTPEQSITFTGGLPNPSPQPISQDWHHNPSYQHAILKTQIANQQTTIEQCKRYDDIEAGLVYYHQRSLDAPNGFANDTLLGLRLQIPLPIWNQNQGAIQKAQASQQRFAQQTHSIAKQIHSESISAQLEMKQWASSISEIEQAMIPIANQQLISAEKSYLNGEVDIQTLLRIREKSTNLFKLKTNALREYHLARNRYLFANNSF